MKLWEKGVKVDEQIINYTVGNDYIIDNELIEYDCIQSIAHAKMLHKINILNKEELKSIIEVLQEINQLNKSGNFKIQKEQEDCHTAIENYLTKKLGAVGQKIHTARSRNDQIVTVLRLYYKSACKNVLKFSSELQTSIENFIYKFGDIEIPGYTHMQKAMPSTVKIWGKSFIDSMDDNINLLEAVIKLIDQSPLGTGAGYGIPLKIDRNLTAKELGFSRIQNNPIYVQNSRGKFESSLIHALSQIMYDLNKIASDLILFSSENFRFFELPPELYTGSSIMPHKKNPDVLEILRSKYHLVISEEFKIKSLIANLISGYNRDLQLTKEPVINVFNTLLESLNISIVMFNSLSVNKAKCEEAMTEQLFATNQVYKLVEKGVPFREAYKKIAEQFK